MEDANNDVPFADELGRRIENLIKEEHKQLPIGQSSRKKEEHSF